MSEPSRKPERIIWSLITRGKFDKIPVLREIQFKEKRAGNDVRLKDESDDGIDRDNGDVDERSNNRKRGSKKAKPTQRRRKESEGGEEDQSGGRDTEVGISLSETLYYSFYILLHCSFRIPRPLCSSNPIASGSARGSP